MTAADDEAEVRAAASRLETGSPGAGELEEPTPIRKPYTLARPLPAPVIVSVILKCPGCDETATVEARLSARIVKDSDGTGSLALRTRAAKVAHVCGQQSLGLAEGPRSR